MEKACFTDVLAVLGATISEHFGDRDNTYDYISNGLQINPSNYELYVLLGNYYLVENPDLCYLCYENAHYYCEQVGNTDDAQYIGFMITELKKVYDIKIRPCSIIIKGYSAEDLSVCIDGIKKNCKHESYEVIATLPKDITLPSTEEDNVTILSYDRPQEEVFNYMVEHACKDNDIFLYDETALMMPNTLFILRMELYAKDNIGSTGAMSNCATINQIIQENFNSLEECIDFAKKMNLPNPHPQEYKMWLEPYAILIKREALDKVGLFDTELKEHQFMEQDMGLRLLNSGYKNVLCHNCFLFRWTAKCIEKQDYQKVPDDIEAENIEHFKKKWSRHNSPLYYGSVRHELINLMKEPRETPIHVLEVGCGTGATLSHIQYLFPNASVNGIEIVDEIARLGAMNLDIISGDVENMELPYVHNSFDYIIFEDVLEHLCYPEDVLIHMKDYLKPEGHIITSIPNLMNARVIYDLLHGNFTYKDAGILDRTHLRFFTYKEIVKMFERTGYQIDQMLMNINGDHCTDNFKDFFDELLSIKGIAEKNEFDTFQYYVLATKKELVKE